MLYVLEGDYTKASAKAATLIEALVKKEPNALVSEYTSESFEPAILPELIAGQGLFAPNLLVVLRRVFEDAEAKAAVGGAAKALGESSNVFLLIEEKVDAATKKKLEKYAKKWETLGEAAKKKAAEKGRYERFAFSDALAARDRKMLWVHYQQAKLENVPDELLVDALFWQLKTMLLAETSASPEEAGLKAFPYRKAKEALAKFPGGEVARTAERLLALYHDARRGKHDLGEALERFILTA